MFKTNLKLILRNIWKYKGFSVINILGLSVGMACSILILLWVKYHTSFDDFHTNSGNVYRVIQHIKFEDYTTWCITQGPLGPSLKEEVPEITDYCRLSGSGLQFLKGEEALREGGTYADPSFFDMFTIKVTKKLKNEPISEPNNIAISESFAKKYFGEEDPIGKTISALPDREFLVTAVFEDYPKETHWWFDYMIPFEHLGTNFGYTIDQWDNSGYFTYVSLNNGITREQGVEKIEDFLQSKPTLEEFAKLDLQSLQDIHLTTGYDFEYANTVDGKYVQIFLIIGVFLIVIACINFMNLSTARASRRTREIGMKKVSGAHKPSLISQFLGETILITFISIIIAMMLVELARPAFNNITHIGLNIDYSDIRIYLALLGIVLITGIFAGSYPALYLSSFKPINVLKGSIQDGKKNLRRILVIFQFTISIVLITATLIMTKQINFMLNKDLGYDKENIIYFYMQEGFYEHYSNIKEELLQHPGIINMTRTGSVLTDGYNYSNSRFRWDGQDLSKETLFRALFVDYDYFSTFNIKISEGRAFSDKFASDSNAIILNESSVAAMNLDSPLGKFVWTKDNPIKKPVIGVAKNYHFRSLRSHIDNQIIRFEPDNCSWAFLKININRIEEIRELLTEHWNRYEKQNTFNINFLDESLAQLYNQDKVIRSIIVFFTFIGMFISILGLTGMTSFIIDQRTKEVGIRKVMGAKFRDIHFLLSSSFLKWILLSFIISTPITYYFMNRWLENFAYKINIQWWVFLIGGLIALFLALLIVSTQTIKASRTNPADTLRYE